MHWPTSKENVTQRIGSHYIASAKQCRITNDSIDAWIDVANWESSQIGTNPIRTSTVSQQRTIEYIQVSWIRCKIHLDYLHPNKQIFDYFWFFFCCRYKTELCRPFKETGECKYGEKCQFAHGENELRTVQRHPKYKTEYCRTFYGVGLCPYGSRCHFLHDLCLDVEDNTRMRAAATNRNEIAALRNRIAHSFGMLFPSPLP